MKSKLTEVPDGRWCGSVLRDDWRTSRGVWFRARLFSTEAEAADFVARRGDLYG